MNRNNFKNFVGLFAVLTVVFSSIFWAYKYFFGRPSHLDSSSVKTIDSQEDSTKRVDVFYCVDESSTLSTCVSVVSVLKNVSKDRKVNFHFIYLDDNKMSQENISKFESLKTSIRDFNINYISFDSSRISGFDNQHWHKSISVKLFAPSLFSDLQKVLWLDHDVILTKGIDELYDRDLTGKYIAAVDLSRYYNKYGGVYYNSPYWITAGIGLYNLQELRKDNIEEKLINCAKTYNSKNLLKKEKGKVIGGVEEYALTNVIKKEKALLLPYRYSVMCTFDNFGRGHFKSEEKEIKNNVALHFGGPWKPWKGRSGILPYYYEFWDYYFKLTPYYKHID
jgi:lipopolysaccharide biosynthesis glycosyltransferase